MEHNVTSLIYSQVEAAQMAQSELFKSNQEKEIQEIVKKYAEKEEKMAKVYKQVRESLAENIISQKREAIILGKEWAEITLLEQLEIKKQIIEQLLSSTEDSMAKEILQEQLQEVEVATQVKEKVSSLTPSSDIDEKDNKIANNWAVSTSLPAKKLWPNESRNYDTKPYLVDLSIVKEDGDILFYDRSKLGFPVDLWITFPTLFSYSNVGISAGKTYYNTHQWVDIRTLPYALIDIKFPEEKTGIVVYAKSDTYGNHLIIDNKELQERYEYAHLSKFHVKEGDTVSWGQLIATTGNTGPYSHGHHLHYAAYKNGFLSTYDWGIDVKKVSVLKDFLTDAEIAFVKDYFGKRPAWMFEAIAIYMQLPQELKNKESFSEIIKAFNNAEKQGKYAVIDIVKEPFIAKNIKLKPREITINVVQTVDKFETKRKWMMIDYFKKDLNNLTVLYHEEKLKKTLGENISSAKIEEINNNQSNNNVEKEGVDDEKASLTAAFASQRDDLFNDKYMAIPIVAERRKLVDLKECNSERSSVFSLYTPLQSQSDGDVVDLEKINNVNHLFPLILQAAKENNIAARINEKMELHGEKKISNCEIALMEIGKVYQEHHLFLDNPDRAGLFQVLTNNYYNEFPEDVGKKVLSDAQYKKQAKDSMEHSFGKLSYIGSDKNFRGYDATKDFILKYWTWSYHGLVGDNPEKNYYTANNLMYKSLPIRDISATPGRKGYRDGAFTIAVKYYKLTH